MPLADEKIRALVHTTDNIEEAKKILRNSLSPMGRACYGIDEMATLDKKIAAIGAELEMLQKEMSTAELK